MAIVGAFRLVASGEYWVSGAARSDQERGKRMAARGLLVVLFGVGVVLSGCMQSTIESASEANLTVRDKKLLAAAPYEKATIPEPYRRHLVQYHRKEAPGTIVIDSDARYLYYVLPEGKAIRYLSLIHISEPTRLGMI